MSENQIPKVFHYCWFGGNELTESVKKCIQSWEKYCPEYQIIRWDESNYDYTKNKYMREAYQQKKWGFVSDYARLDILYNYGGIYLDTDVEIIRSFDDLLEYKAFMGFENNYVALGLGFGARKHVEEIKEMRDEYENLSFILPDGSLNMRPVPRYTTEYLEARGLVANGTRQTINGIEIFPTEYFCPKDFYTKECKKTKNTYSIHHYDSSWWGEEEKSRYEKEAELKAKNLWLWRIQNGVRVLKEDGIRVLIKKIVEMLKSRKYC